MQYTVRERAKQPLYPTRLVNLLGKLKKPLLFNPSSLIEDASKLAKLTDWGDEDFLPALDAFCSAVNADSDMHHLGKIIIQRTIVESLVDRLQIQDTIKQIPEILRKPVQKPIMIQGEPRAGTTLLHRLLAQDPQFRTLLLWETIFPTPPPNPKTYGVDKRIEQAERLFKQILRVAPTLAITHPMDAKLPEECWPLLQRAFIRPLDCLFLNIPEYQEWMLARTTENMNTEYLYYRKQLQILQFRFANARYVLKTPIHGFFMNSIAEVFPDVCFIHCHRDPKEILPSVCSLSASRGASFYSFIDFEKLGQRVMHYGRSRMNRLMDARIEIGSTRFFDLSFMQMMREPLRTVKALYQWLNLELSPQVEAQMIEFIHSQRQGRHKAHQYSLEQFKLVPAEIDRTYERYMDEFRSFME